MGDPEHGVPHPDDAPRKAEAQAAVVQQVSLDPAPGEPIWARIRRHKVVEWTLAYIAFGYALLHGVQMLRETFDWPSLVPRLTVFSIVLGAPVAVTLAWYHGHRARHRVSGSELSILIALLLVAGSVLWWLSRSSHERAAAGAVAASNPAAGTATPAPPFNPPPHSIAVLPFVNMSGDTAQEYFSDGLSEELLNSLSRISELQVAARTSSFYFKGEHADLPTIAHRLNVASVLEGSIRRSGNTIRVTAQLSNGVTGYHLWSQTYDRNLRDVLAMQADIANAVAGALKVTLLGDVAAKIEIGGTRNPAAFDAYLRATKAYHTFRTAAEEQAAIADYGEAIRLDSNYALAYAARSLASGNFAENFAIGSAVRTNLDNAQADATNAIAMAPDLADGHVALGAVLERSLDFIKASEQYEQALSLAPGNAMVLKYYGSFAVFMGHGESGLTALRRAVALDPMNENTYLWLGIGLAVLGRARDALGAYNDARVLDPDNPFINQDVGLAYYTLGDFENARTWCEKNPGNDLAVTCLAMAYDKLGRRADAERMLAKLQTLDGESGAMLYAYIYAQRGDTARSLDWLDASMRMRSPWLGRLKESRLLDPLRKEPRFQAIERKLKFPE